MKGLDDGPDGLNDRAWDRAMVSGVRRIRRARVIRTGLPDQRPTVAVPYKTLADEADAWSAELASRR